MNRLKSVDVFRGLTVMLMIVVNNPGSWDHIYAPLEHASWHGCTPTDLVFPFFLFIVGISIALANRTDIKQIWPRALKIFAIGLCLNVFSKLHIGDDFVAFQKFALAIIFGMLIFGKSSHFLILALVLLLLAMLYVGPLNDARLLGVLQRIAICYFIISILYKTFNIKILALIAFVVLLSYWFAMAVLPVPGIGAPSYDAGVNLAAWIDGILLKNHCWATTKTWDPEGVLSTFPAICTCILGLLCGNFLKSTTKNKAQYLFAIGIFGVGNPRPQFADY